MVQNKGIIFTQIPRGWPVDGQDLKVEIREFDLEQQPPEGGVTVRTFYASLDPYQRNRMRPANVELYATAFTIGQPIFNCAISKIIKSDTPKFQPDDIIISSDVTPFEEYSALDKDFVVTAEKLDNQYKLDPKLFLGALGMPGLTAWGSLYGVCKPKKGEVIFVSAASGGVGQLVCQLAKYEGLTVIGSVGSDAKLDFIMNELGLDGGFNYHKENPLDALARLAPGGLDIYYDNTGGEQLEAALEHMKLFGRVVACGHISQYNIVPENRYGVRNTIHIFGKRLNVQGFIVSDANMAGAYAQEHQEKLQKLLADGSIKAKQDVTVGIDNAIDGFLGMLKGKNFGKAVLQIAELEGEALANVAA